MTTDDVDIEPSGARKIVGLVLAPALAATALALPLPVSEPAHRLAAIFLAVVVLWVTEALPIAVTALLIAPALVIAGITDAPKAFAPYANPLLYLFVGGFFMAEAMAKHGLDHRLADALMRLPGVRRPRTAILVASLLLSMWISNTATTAMLLPILLGALRRTSARSPADADEAARVPPDRQRAEVGSILTVAYGSSIGGLGTLLGSPPNLITVGILRESAGARVSFLGWMAVGLPVAVLLLLAMHLLFARLFPDPVPDHALRDAPRERRPWSRSELVAASAFGLAVVGWILPEILKAVGAPHADAIKKALPEGVVALVACVPLFLVGERRGGPPVLRWREAARIDWGVIILFGGGLALGDQLVATGLAEYLSRSVLEASGIDSLWTLTAVATLFSILLTEACSNTATAAMLIPIVVAGAHALGVSPIPPALAAGMGASAGFMLPVATGPNALAYGTRRVPLGAMLRAGLVLDLVACPIILLVLYGLAPVFGWR